MSAKQEQSYPVPPEKSSVSLSGPEVLPTPASYQQGSYRPLTVPDNRKVDGVDVRAPSMDTMSSKAYPTQTTYYQVL